MERKNYLTNLSLLVVALFIVTLTSGCSILRLKPEKEVVVKYVETQRNIPLQSRPKPLDFSTVQWKVVTDQNFDEFIEQYKVENGEAWVFYVVTVRDYENLALNMADLRRFVEQQKEIIVYYEEAVKPKTQTEGDD